MSDNSRPYELAPQGHEWRRDEDGEVDIFAYTEGQYCNGPECVKCGYGFCHHCQELPVVSCEASRG